jgi:hypothetical protein
LQTSCLHGGWWGGNDLDGMPDGYHAINDREAIKVMIEF